jgi:pimeloyl-ACP methyl ester carboxylesterase
VTDQTLPPLRTACTWRSPLGPWSYDTWGSHGRPILLIPAVLFDRTVWWPVAAELRPYATVIAVDLPGHGGTVGRRRYHPDDLVAELALLLHTLGIRQAPIVVGHASAAPLAVHFAARCSAHAVVAVDPPGPHEPLLEHDEYLTAFDLDAIPTHYRDLAMPAFDPELLSAYAACRRLEEPSGDPATVGRPTHLALHSRPPSQSPTVTADGRWRNHVYAKPGRFAQLTDVPRFARDLRRLL